MGGERHERDGNVLAVDVANGLTRLGAFDGDELLGSWEVSTPRHLTADEAREQALDALDRIGSDASSSDVDTDARLQGAILSCVVPTHAEAWTRALASLSDSRPVVVGPGLRTGLRMRLENPGDVGSDRIANVVAAREKVGASALVVSLGTTTNIEVVDDAGAFVGGAIAPGVMLGARALDEAAARLPLVELQVPRRAIGRNTREAIQAGVVLGEAARVDGLLDVMAEELGGAPRVVVTGHHAAVVAPLLRHEVMLDEQLTLRGLALIWGRLRS